MSRKLFLKTVKASNPKLFVIFVVFIVINLGFNVVGIEADPFFVYNMYSAPSPHQEIGTVYVLECDGVPFNEPQFWNHHRRMMFNYSIGYYDRSIQADSSAADGIKALQFLNKFAESGAEYYQKVYTQKEDFVRYPKWLKTYMQSLLHREIKHIKVYKVQVAFQADGRLKELSKSILCEA